MRPAIILLSLFSWFIVACSEKPSAEKPKVNLQGSWKLLTGTLIENGDTTVTDYTRDRSFIKMLNQSHFAFLGHRLASDTPDFSGGGGRYRLDGDQYTEYLDYCNAKEWEGHEFHFTVSVHGDTLVQQGVEKIQAQGINRLNIERYLRIR